MPGDRGARWTVFLRAADMRCCRTCGPHSACSCSRLVASRAAPARRGSRRRDAEMADVRAGHRDSLVAALLAGRQDPHAAGARGRPPAAVRPGRPPMTSTGVPSALPRPSRGRLRARTRIPYGAHTVSHGGLASLAEDGAAWCSLASDGGAPGHRPAAADHRYLVGGTQADPHRHRYADSSGIFDPLYRCRLRRPRQVIFQVRTPLPRPVRRDPAWKWSGAITTRRCPSSPADPHPPDPFPKSLGRRPRVAGTVSFAIG